MPRYEREILPYDAIRARGGAIGVVRGVAAATVKEGLTRFVARTQPDEVIVVAQIYDQAARLRSYEIVAGL